MLLKAILASSFCSAAQLILKSDTFLAVLPAAQKSNMAMGLLPGSCGEWKCGPGRSFLSGTRRSGLFLCSELCLLVAPISGGPSRSAFIVEGVTSLGSLCLPRKFGCYRVPAWLLCLTQPLAALQSGAF